MCAWSHFCLVCGAELAGAQWLQVELPVVEADQQQDAEEEEEGEQAQGAGTGDRLLLSAELALHGATLACCVYILYLYYLLTLDGGALACCTYRRCPTNAGAMGLKASQAWLASAALGTCVKQSAPRPVALVACADGMEVDGEGQAGASSSRKRKGRCNDGGSPLP